MGPPSWSRSSTCASRSDSACRRLEAAYRVRLGLHDAWSLSVSGGVATYAYRFAGTDVALDDFGRGPAVEIVTHGVDVSDCPTPTLAIAKVRRVAGASVGAAQ